MSETEALQKQIDELRAKIESFASEHADFRKVHVSRRGVEGPPGVPGTKGEPGRDGKDGAQGTPGRDAQNVPVPGPQGPAGKDGRDGVNGRDGKDGVTGPQGPVGKDGKQGERGEAGPTGAKGDTGTLGKQGERGISGTRGDTGAQGARGEKGAIGPEGPEGKQGNVGPRGPAGDIAAAVGNAERVARDVVADAKKSFEPAVQAMTDVLKHTQEANRDGLAAADDRIRNAIAEFKELFEKRFAHLEHEIAGHILPLLHEYGLLKNGSPNPDYFREEFEPRTKP